MRIRLSVLFMIILVLSHQGIVIAQTTIPLPRAEEMVSALGWTASEVFDNRGAPEKMFPYRGTEESEDTVVFFYSDRTYLFFFRDRVWQVRADENWKGQVDGVSMGMSQTEVELLWGPPINRNDVNPTWTLPDEGYPVRIRLYFDTQGALVDLYVYRSDW